MLRIWRIQPLIEETRIVAAGRRLCWIALPMNEPVQAGHHAGVEAAGRREEAARPGEQFDRDQAEPEVRHRREERGDRQQGVRPRAAPPAGDHAEAGAEHEADHRGDADQRQGPRQALRDDRGHRRREEGERQAEIAVHELPPVVAVLREEALVLVQSEQDVERSDRLRVHLSLELR